MKKTFFFIEAGAGAGVKNTRSRCKKGPAPQHWSLRQYLFAISLFEGLKNVIHRNVNTAQFPTSNS